MTNMTARLAALTFAAAAISAGFSLGISDPAPPGDSVPAMSGTVVVDDGEPVSLATTSTSSTSSSVPSTTARPAKVQPDETGEDESTTSEVTVEFVAEVTATATTVYYAAIIPEPPSEP